MNNAEMEQIYDKFSGAVYRAAFAYCKNSADAEDITQEAFIKRFQSNIDFRDEKAEKAWLMKVTANRCRDMFRSPRYRFMYHSVPLEEAGLIYETPEESAVFRAVMELPPKYRIAVHLYYYEGYSVAETAEITGKSETAVQTQLYRARKMLKKALGEEMYL
ncbi:RNA polymerase sigma factor [uncultured Ruminococcus sp.]|uniref:RNA polymerase sigma factor n=1 Tax=uncultured Ruminococcus sp. TaxID=165186 RepID=UPI0026095068|nr:sigma-70 family RNA polymerase sigma factor [uncultured Ruminococcus sp.]